MAKETLTRVLRVKIEPTKEQWQRLRDLAWQSARYHNQFSLAQWCKYAIKQAYGDAMDPTMLEKWVRANQKGELSGSAYSAAEREVTSTWTRDGKRIKAGAPLSQWRDNDALAIRGHKDRAKSGVRIETKPGGWFAHLRVQNEACEGGCWITVPISMRPGQDEWQGSLLDKMVSGDVPVLKAVVVFKPMRGRTMLHLAYAEERNLPPPGERVAQLGPRFQDGNLTLRTECETRSYTHKVAEILSKKDNWDGIRRRFYRQANRHKGSTRRRKQFMADASFSDWCETYCHQWSREIIDWCAGQGIGRLVLLDVGGGDWPAHMMEEMLRYKANEAGMVVDNEPHFGAAATERTAKSAVNKRRRQAKKIGDAARTLSNLTL